MCPGKKEFVSVKINSHKEHKQKRLLLHIEYKNKTNNPIGFSKFCELRPKWCIPVGSASGLYSVCVCEYHQNAKLLVIPIPGIIDYKEILKMLVCDRENRDCMLRAYILARNLYDNF